MDREKVIKGLEICKNPNGRCAECPYNDGEIDFSNCTSILCVDVLALLKEQDEKIKELQNAYNYLQRQFFEVQDKLLKEQEAVEPKQIGQGWFCGVCDALLSISNEKIVKFCSMCGKPIKWE